MSQQPPPSLGATSDGFLFLSYNSLDRGEVQAVQQHLRTRGIPTFLDRDQLRAGMPWFDALQEAVGKARAAAVFVGRDGLGTWQKREMELALDRQAKEEKTGGKFPVIPVVLQGAELEKAPGFLLLNTWVDLRGRLDDTGALDALAQAVRGEAALPLPSAAATLPPYRALRAFREEDAPLFFGREAFAEELLRKTLSQQLVAVVGASGSGKSSVVQAGLLPLLRREHPPSATWDVAIFTPGRRPFHNLAAALIPMLEPEASETQRLREAEGLGGDLAGRRVALEAAVNQVLKKSSGTERLLIVVDQFEELFTLTAEAERRSFINSLLEAIPAMPLTVLLTLRADFYGRAIDSSRDLSDRMQRGQVNLGPMTREELRRAVESPARAVGLEFESGLVGRILDNVEEEPGNLPLLEFALTELWERRQGGQLSNEKYDEIGGVEGAISQRAEEQFGRLRPEQQAAAVRLLSRLVRVAAATEEGTDTRQRVKLSELDEAQRGVVQSFVEARLLVTSRNEATGDETIEVAHEALIRRWIRLKELINEDREFLLWRQRLGMLLGEWQRTGQGEDALLRGASLAEAKKWLRERERDLSEGEREFVRVSTRKEVTTRRTKRWGAAAVAALVLLVGAGVVGRRLWVRRDAYQIATILERAPGVVPLCAGADDAYVVPRWVRALVRTGHVNEVDKVIAALRKEHFTQQSLNYNKQAEIAFALTKIGRTDEALAAIQEIDDPSVQDHSRFFIAGALAEAGKPDVALAGLRLEKVDEFPDGTLHTALVAVTEAGRANEALAAIQQLKNPYSKATALASEAKALAKVGEGEKAKAAAAQALELIPEIEMGSKTQALVATAGALAKVGESEKAKAAAAQALAIIPEIKEETWGVTPSELLIYSMRVFASVGKADEALSIIRHFHYEPVYVTENLASAAGELAEAGEAGKAKTVAHEVLAAIHQSNDATWGNSKAGILAKVAGALAESGEAEEARMVADEALTASANNDDASRSEASAEVAKVLAKLQNYYEALEVAERCSSPKKLDAYAAILIEYHRARNPDLAKALAVEAKDVSYERDW